MRVIIEIYIFICIMLLIFHIAFLVTKNFKNRKFYPPRNKMKSMLGNEFKLFNPEIGLSEKLQTFLKEDIDKTKNLIILQNQIEETTTHKDILQEKIRPYIFKKIEVYRKKSDYEQAYFAYVISMFNYEEGECKDCFTSSFITFLESKSIYVFTNAMIAICKFKDPYLVSISIQKVSERNGFYHSKLFIDGLLEFTGNLDTLHGLMIDNFYEYSPEVQESLLNYFRIKKADMDDFCLDLLKEKKVEKEVRYAAMRYFNKKDNEETKEYFIDLLKRDDIFWIEELLAIQGLKQYKDLEVKRAIKSKVTSRNWHVRINAISYLQKYMESRDEINDILMLNDKYTNETLLYFYKNNAEMTEFITKTMNLLREDEERLQKMQLNLKATTMN